MTIPVWDRFGHKSGRLFHLSISSWENPDTQQDLSQQRCGHTSHSGDEGGAKRKEWKENVFQLSCCSEQRGLAPRFHVIKTHI